MKKIIDKFEEVILVLFLIAMSSVLMLQIIARYIFHSSFTWSEELVRYLFVWSTFVGIPYCIKKGISLKITQFVDVLPNKTKILILMINKFILLIFFTILTICGFLVTKTTYFFGQKSPALELPLWLVYFSVFFGSGLAVIRILEKIILACKNKELASKADY